MLNQTLVVAAPNYTNHIAQAIVGDWRMSISALIQTGPPLYVSTVFDQALTRNGTIQRPNLAPPDPFLPNKGPAGRLNPKAFAQPALGTFGNMGFGVSVGTLPGGIPASVGPSTNSITK